MPHLDQDSEITVMLCGDRKVLKGMEVALFSALHHLGSGYRLRVLLFSLNIPPLECDQLELRLARTAKPFRLERIELNVGQVLAGRTLRPFYGGIEPYAKVLLAGLVKGAKRAIYLDTDVVVCTCLSTLAQVDLQANAVGAVPEATVARAMEGAFYRRQGFSDEEPFFNSGVMLIDVERWKAQGLTPRCLQVLDGHGAEVTSDQTVLNVVLRKAFTPLPPRFNQLRFPSCPPVDPGSAEGIYHLVGRPKPWELFGEFVHRSGPLFCKYLDLGSARPWRSYRQASWQSLLASARLCRSYYSAFANRKASDYWASVQALRESKLSGVGCARLS